MKKGKLKQACRKNEFKFTIEFMIGDADGSETGIVYSPTYEGEIEELYKIYSKQIKIANKGLGLDGCEELNKDTRELILANPILMAAVTRGEDPKKEEYLEDWVADYQATLGDYGSNDLGGYSPRMMELTYFDENGDEWIMKP